MGKHRLIASILSLSVLGLSLAACSAEELPGPEDAAAGLARGLSQLDVAGNVFADSTVEAVNGMLGHLVSGMAPLKPEVTVTAIDEISGNEAEATLNYVWDVNASETDYSYQTTVVLARGAENQWETRFRSTTVHPDLLPGERLVRETTPVPRADILGAGGDVLVRERPVWRVGIDKSVLNEREYASSANYLSIFLGLDSAAYTAQVQAAGPTDFIDAVTLRQDSVPPDFESDIATIPGAAALPERKSLSPSGSFAQALLGTVGEATAERSAEVNGALAPGDQTGLSGLQLEYDTQLRGTDAVRVHLEKADGAPEALLFEAEGSPGEPLQTTLDPGLQSLAESVLEDVPANAALVALQPSTGSIRAAANGPGSEGAQTALLGRYAPGSSFHLASSLAMLRAGSTPGTMVPCPPELEVDGRSFTNPGTYPAEFLGDIPLRQALAQSCRTAFVNAGDDVSQSDLAAAARSLGLGVDAPIGTPAFFGSVPQEAEGALHAASMTGQGDVLASPLGLAVAGASAARGERVVPTLVTGTAADEAGGQESGEAPEPLTDEEASALRTMMRTVVSEGGGQILQEVPGEAVLALTGSAESAGDAPPRTHAWVVAAQGDLAVALFIDAADAGSGGEVVWEFLNALAG